MYGKNNYILEYNFTLSKSNSRIEKTQEGRA